MTCAPTGGLATVAARKVWLRPLKRPAVKEMTCACSGLSHELTGSEAPDFCTTTRCVKVSVMV